MTAPTGLIALVGATGSGKSSFTNAILGEYHAAVGDELESLTAEVSEYALTLPNGTTVRVVDTPGFNDFRSDGAVKSDLDILQMIAGFLKSEHDSERKFSGIIYMHNITSPRVDRMMRRNMSLFKKLCGSESMKNVVVVTTFWDMLVDIEDGLANEAELQSEAGLLKDLYDGGAKFVRAGKYEEGECPSGEEYPTPREIVEYLLSLDPVYVQMQKEMAAGASVADTGAGASLLEEFEELKRECRQSIEDVNSQLFALRSACEEDRSHRDLLKTESQKLKDQLLAWEVQSREMKSKMEEWENQQVHVATKGDLEAWQNAHRLDLDGLRLEFAALKRAKEDADRQQATVEQRNAELARALEKVEKERDELAEERRELQRSNRHIQDLYVAQTALTGQREAEKSALKDGIHEVQIRLSQAQSANELTSERLRSALVDVERMREELRKRDAEQASLQDELAHLRYASRFAPFEGEAKRKEPTQQRFDFQRFAGAESRKEAQRLFEEKSKKLVIGLSDTVKLYDEPERIVRAGHSPTQSHSPLGSTPGPSESSSPVRSGSPSGDHEVERSPSPVQVLPQRVRPPLPPRPVPTGSPPRRGQAKDSIKRLIEVYAH